MRPEARAGDARSPTPPQDAMQVDRLPVTSQNITTIRPEDVTVTPSQTNGPEVFGKMDVVNSLRREAQQSSGALSRPSTPSQTQSPRMPVRDLQTPRAGDEHAQRTDVSPSMPPPTAPSQTLPAQVLRTTARQTAVPGTLSASSSELRIPSQSETLHLRSSSPASRPGTRNHSADSRASGDRRSRSDRELDRDDDGKRPGTEGASRSERIERSGGAHRDVLHGRSERNGRERIPGSSLREAERERDSDRGDRRDRSEKDKDRDREKERERDREKRREREPSHRERDREREKDGDRHRRDDRDRDREQRRDSRGVNSTQRDGDTQGDHGPPRSDSGRHRNSVHGATEDSLGKRRRPADDEVCLLCGFIVSCKI